MSLNKFEINYGFEPHSIGGEQFEALFVEIGNPDGDLIFDEVGFHSPIDATSTPGTKAITIYVKQTEEQNGQDPLVIRYSHLMKVKDLENGVVGEIFCYYTPLVGNAVTKRPRKTTVHVSTGGGGRD